MKIFTNCHNRFVEDGKSFQVMQMQRVRLRQDVKKRHKDDRERFFVKPIR